MQDAQFKFASHVHTVRPMRDEVWAGWAFSSDNLAARYKAARVSVAERSRTGGAAAEGITPPWYAGHFMMLGFRFEW